MKELIVFDDTKQKSEIINDIIGDKGFSDVVVKRRKLEDYYKNEIESIFSDVIWKKIVSSYEYSDLLNYLETIKDNSIRVIHCFSNYIISDIDKAMLCFKKVKYIEEEYLVLCGNTVAAIMFHSMDEYIKFCESVNQGRNAWDLARNINNTMEIEGLVDISVIDNFIQCITGNFDSRYFNSLKGNEYILVKSSTNKKKIKAEYSFYHLLPEDMKYWFVIPFNYTENEKTASYSMERLYMTDLAIKWVHGSMDEEEFETLMDKYFYFFKSRHVRTCSEEEYRTISKSLYEDKVVERIADLKKLPEFEKVGKLLDACDDGISIDALVDKYFKLKHKIESGVKFSQELVIGHGDPCFANAMYNKSTRTLKFIDPKGALCEEELWTNAYYDIAKLSHSVCGRYDFFNNGLFDIRIDGSFEYELDIPFDNSKFINIFRRKVEENGFDYLTVRIYEASLFLSMLPLHIDNPHKVFGFILNVRNILKEIEENV